MAECPLKRPVKLALIQLAAGSDKAANLQRASEKVAEAAKDGADIVVLPVIALAMVSHYTAQER
jgi:predicted amidohydrolase